MEIHRPVRQNSRLMVMLGAAAIALVAGAGLAAWHEHGAGVFAAMVETGLAWCF